MDPSVYISEHELQRLSAITEFAEFLEDPSSLEDGATAASDDVEYFLVDDSPMAKFSRSIKWAYKKVSRAF